VSRWFELISAIAVLALCVSLMRAYLRSQVDLGRTLAGAISLLSGAGVAHSFYTDPTDPVIRVAFVVVVSGLTGMCLYIVRRRLQPH